jgi:copper(I)-binding protein
VEEFMKSLSSNVLAVVLSLTAVATFSVRGHAQQKSGMEMVHLVKPAPAGAVSAQIGAIALSGGYVRAMLPGQPVGGGYITIHNGGDSDDRLVKVTSSAAGAVELHQMTMENDVMRMRELKDGIVIRSGNTVILDPDGCHMMFKHVKALFKQGGTVTVTLRFEKAGPIDLALPVMAINGS